MSQILLGIQPLNPFEKFCFWALMVAVNVLQSANSKLLIFPYRDNWNGLVWLVVRILLDHLWTSTSKLYIRSTLLQYRTLQNICSGIKAINWQKHVRPFLSLIHTYT